MKIIKDKIAEIKKQIKDFKFESKHLCTAVQLLYHVSFLGGAAGLGTHYLGEYQKTRDVIVEQVSRAEKIIEDAKVTATKVTTSTNKSINGITKELEKVRKACKF